MKLLILVLLLISIYSRATAQDNLCQNQNYELGNQQDLDTQLDGEYCPIAHATKKITSLWRSSKATNEDTKLKELCACALYKVEKAMFTKGQTTPRTYQEILEKTSVTGTSYVRSSTAYWFMFNYKPLFPYASCSSDTDSCVIVKGFKNLSTTAPVYNLYVGKHVTKADNTKKLVLKGVIKEVKVDVLQ